MPVGFYGKLPSHGDFLRRRVSDAFVDAWDAWLLTANAIPAAVKAAKPGTPEFRKALRDAIEGTRDLVSSQGVFNMTPTDHVGYDLRASVMVQIKNSKWLLVK